MGKRQKKRIKGNNFKPRLSIHRSNRHIYAQVIDDSSSRTIISCSTLDLDIKSRCLNTSNKIASKLVGEIIGTKLLNEKITQIIFDRGKKPYHGRIKEVAEGVRLTGLKF
uniref:Large ribosomal subunit protein uL18c n=1 Tax=Coccophora langsdorfii TaxID=74099 RepID=A0A1L2F1N6_9PHAE|nr:ribosomal protein L18 [Coccophora langsdorfii]ANS72254.1 ribosomal protein L18 [Coccophora langsdorfii]